MQVPDNIRIWIGISLFALFFFILLITVTVQGMRLIKSGIKRGNGLHKASGIMMMSLFAILSVMALIIVILSTK